MREVFGIPFTFRAADSFVSPYLCIFPLLRAAAELTSSLSQSSAVSICLLDILELPGSHGKHWRVGTNLEKLLHLLSRNL